MLLRISERIGCPHRTEIRYVLTCGQLGHHHKVSNPVLMPQCHFCITLKPICDSIHYDCEKMMVFPCDQSVQSECGPILDLKHSSPCNFCPLQRCSMIHVPLYLFCVDIFSGNRQLRHTPSHVTALVTGDKINT